MWLQEDVVQKHEQYQFSITEIFFKHNLHLILWFFYADVYQTGELLSHGGVFLLKNALM